MADARWKWQEWRPYWRTSFLGNDSRGTLWKLSRVWHALRGGWKANVRSEARNECFRSSWKEKGTRFVASRVIVGRSEWLLELWFKTTSVSGISSIVCCKERCLFGWDLLVSWDLVVKNKEYTIDFWVSKYRNYIHLLLNWDIYYW